MKHNSSCLQLLSFNPQTDRFTLNQQALDFIQQLDKPVAITSISGSICSGKSYLLNQLFSQPQEWHPCFKVGSKCTPETKGMWISLHPIPSANKDYYHLAMDSGGLSSVDKDSDYDLKILLFGIIVSSTMVYNHFGAIEQFSLEQLRLGVEMKKYCFDQEICRMPFADLVWVARDFGLSLTDRMGVSLSEGDYFEAALKDIEGSSEEIVGKNDTKRSIRQAFPRRHCYTLVRPTINETVLRDLQQNSDKINPKFSSKVEAIKRDILLRSVPKRVNGEVMSVKSLVGMLGILVKSLNHFGNIGTIGWNSVAMQANEKAFSSSLSSFGDKLRALGLPMNAAALKQVLRGVVDETEKGFLRHSMEEEGRSLLAELRSAMQKQIDLLMAENIQSLRKTQRDEFEEIWSDSSIMESVARPLVLKECLSQIKTRLGHKEQWIALVQRLEEVILLASHSLQAATKQREESISEVDGMKVLRSNYVQMKSLHEASLTSMTSYQDRINFLESQIQSSEQQFATMKAALEDSKALLGKEREKNLAWDRIQVQHKEETQRLHRQQEELQSQVSQKSEESSQQMKIFLKQKAIYEQQEKFYQKQVEQLKEGVLVAKNNYQRSSQNLLQNNQILRNLEIIKNIDIQRTQSRFKPSHPDDSRLKALLLQVSTLETKVFSLQATITQLTHRVTIQHQTNYTLRTQLQAQIQLNKQAQNSKRSYEQMVDSLESNLDVMNGAHERDRRMYEQSVLRLISNVEKREEMFTKRERRDRR